MMIPKCGVKVTPIVCDQQNNVLKRYPEQSNMTTKTGLQMMMTTPLAECMKVAAIGRGVTPTYRKEVCTLTKTGNTITANASIFVEADETHARTLQMSDGQLFEIVTVDANTSCTVTDSTIEGTYSGVVIWNFEQQTLSNAVSTSSVYNTHEPEYNGSASGTITIGDNTYLKIDITRTFQFDIDSEVLITEAGWGNALSGATLFLFGRILLDEPVPLVAGHRMLLKVTMTRLFDITDVSADILFGAPAVWDISALPTNGSAYSTILADGTSSLIGPYLPMLEPCATAFNLTFVGGDNSALAAYDDSVGKLVPASAYRTWSVYTEPEDYTTPISSLVYGMLGNTRILKFVYATSQTASLADTYRLKFIVQWGRFLPAYSTLN